MVGFVMDEMPKEVKITSITMVTSDLRKKSFPELNYQVPPTGIEDITANEEEVVIYTLQGVRIFGKLENLPQGIYIINGKKTII